MFTFHYTPITVNINVYTCKAVEIGLYYYSGRYYRRHSSVYFTSS